MRTTVGNRNATVCWPEKIFVGSGKCQACLLKAEACSFFALCVAFKSSSRAMALPSQYNKMHVWAEFYGYVVIHGREKGCPEIT
jgi:hypothetical protein